MRLPTMVLASCLLLALALALLPAPASAATFVVFQERFEGDWPGPWEAGDDNLDAGADYWGPSSHKASQGQKSAWAAQEGTNSNNGLANSAFHHQDDSMDAYMRVDLGDLSGYDALLLRFDYWIEAGADDSFRVRVSDGATWSTVFVRDGPIGQGWTEAEAALPLSTRFLEFRYVTADTHDENYEGVYVDRVEVQAEDTTPPELSVLSPGAGAWLDTPDATISWRATDDASGVDYVEVRVDAGTWVRGEASGSLLVQDLDEGPHVLDLRAVDRAGNVNLLSRDFGVDLSDPSIVLLTPVSNTISNSASVNVSWTGGDSVSQVGHYEVRLDDGSWVRVEGATFHVLTGVSDGDHVVTVRAVDLAGNTEEAGVRFHVNTNPLHPQGPGQGTLLYGLVALGAVGVLGVLHRTRRVDLRALLARIKALPSRLRRGKGE